MSLIIQTEGLSHHFGALRAVRDVDLAVPAGAVYGFLGPNGSGKTTTIRILLGLLRAKAGRVSILDLPMPRERKAVARSVGSMVEAPSLYDHLTGFENLDITRRILGLPRAEIGRVLEIVALAGDARRRTGAYSLGMRQRLGIARALLGDPKLLILDEPMNGLDPAGVHEMRAMICDLPSRSGVTIFLSSHLLAEVELVATHVGLMFRGELIAQSTLPELLRSAPTTLEIDVNNAPRALVRLRAMGVRSQLSPAGGIDAALRRDGPSAAEINSALVSEGFAVAALQPKAPGLEALFLDLTNGRAPPKEARHAGSRHH